MQNVLSSDILKGLRARVFMAAENHLKNVYLFKELPTDQLEKVSAIARLETMNAGEDIFTQNDQARALYIISYGSVRIQKESSSGKVITVATLGSGSHFGEMALVDSEPRSASATVIEKSEIMILEYSKLLELLRSDLAIGASFYKELARFLCGRLRITTNDLSFARDKNLSHF